MHNRKAVTKVLYHAFVILFGFMMVYPVLWMISGSFKGNAEILRGTLSLIPKELKLTNYANNDGQATVWVNQVVSGVC